MSTDIRRQLEGGIETLEAAYARYALLRRALLKLEWQQATLRRLDTLREVIRQEPTVEEALARLHQRARCEEWPGTEPALGLAQKVERLRSRLDVLTRQHLDMPADWESRLADSLARIEQLLTWTIAAPISSEERVLLQGASRSPNTQLLSLVVFCAFLFAYVVLPVAVFLILSLGYCVFEKRVDGCLEREVLERAAGQYWLTGKRLVWKAPWWGAPIHIPLHAIRPGGVQRLSSFVRVRLVDGRFLFLGPFDEDEGRLVELLKQHCPASRPGESHAPVH